MPKPSKLPAWDTTEVNSVEPDTTHQEEGWLAPGGIPEKPPFQTFNHWMNATWKWIKEFNRQGIVEWDGVTTYEINDITKGSDGKQYESLVGGNTNNNPLTNLDKWIDVQWRKQTTVHNITADSDYTLTALQNRYGRIVISDIGVVLTTTINIVTDNIQKSFIVQNNTLQDLTFKTVSGVGILVIAGSSATLYNDNTDVVVLSREVGVNQTWQDVTGSRVVGVTYTNNTNYPIMVSIISTIGDNKSLTLSVDGLNISNFNASTTNLIWTSTAIIPVGSTYVISTTAAGASWYELREK